MKISNEIKALIKRNINSQPYSHIRSDWSYENGTVVDFSTIKERDVLNAEKDLLIIKERSEAYSNREGLKVGDLINLPDGQQVMVCHVWKDTVQTSGGGSMHISGSGNLSYSGGMDSGLKKTDLIESQDKGTVEAWIFHNGYSGAHRAVYFRLMVNVYTTKDGADLSGVPQVKKLAREKLAQQAETITRINGNGNPYTLPLPRVRIMNTNKEFPTTDTVISGLAFEASAWGNLETQPMKVAEINKLLNEHDFIATFHNGVHYTNTLVLEQLKPSDVRKATRQFPM